MGIPSGDSPSKAQQYYHYLQGHQETMQRADTWHVHWLDLAWLWGFVIVLVLAILLWIWQNRTTRQRAGIYPVDSFGGFTTELAGPATFFFILLTLVLTGWAVVIIVGHIVWGQKF
jgi:polyferredoxin